MADGQPYFLPHARCPSATVAAPVPEAGPGSTERMRTSFCRLGYDQQAMHTPATVAAIIGVTGPVWPKRVRARQYSELLTICDVDQRDHLAGG